MKTFIILVALFIGYASTYAETQIGTQANPSFANGNVAVDVVHPFAVHNVQAGLTEAGTGHSNYNLPDVVKGQKLVLNGNTYGMYIFSVEKDYSSTAKIVTGGSLLEGQVQLKGDWYWTSTQPGATWPSTAKAVGANWDWPAEAYVSTEPYPGDAAYSYSNTFEKYYAILKISEIDATNAVSDANLIFNITISGYYTSL